MKSSNEATVSVSVTNTLLDTAAQLGLNRQQLQSAANLTGETLDNPDQRIPFLNQEKLWSLIIDQHPDIPVGLSMGLRAQPGSFNVLGNIAMNSATLGDAFRHVQHYQNLVGEGGSIEENLCSSSHWIIRYTPLNPGHACTHHRVAAVLSSWVKIGQWLADQFEVLAINFDTPAPPYYQQYEEQLGCPVYFNRSENELVLSPEMRNQPIRQANSTICKLLREQADKLIEQLQTSTLSRQVVSLISQQLMGQEPDKQSIASSLNISARTLQRRLEEEGTSYQKLLSDTRHQLALEYLERADINTSEIAFMLGFSESSTFYRAFKKWTGQTPGQYRNNKIKQFSEI
ncbi:AraC family transcriptional regulator [Aestuariirhabdus sp. Z084]|uniref:AraC family transcriptional regulator n=1 Tax=Aestuariirhabdus haliotis TaxID=2918751 RepID=UPI00201B3F3B|nr:AraC family transcriptional regulator [Aestuariirhabdus haliotis]MCL6415317.1 AraC family transcriptional regulator [Aestuariirhabdus haliotis]MCL6419073.1 AraC family transcriptional regulator [Aestuariirhabdus haliotis]